MSQTRMEPPTFTAEQVNALFRAYPGSADIMRDHAVVATLLDTGLHLSELVTLQCDRLRVTIGPGEKAYVLVRPKDRNLYGYVAPTPLGLHARMALERYLKESRPQSDSRALFLDERGKPLTPQALSRLLARLGKRVEEVMAGTPVTARMLRQTYLATRSKLAAGESVLDHLDDKWRRQRLGLT